MNNFRSQMVAPAAEGLTFSSAIDHVCFTWCSPKDLRSSTFLEMDTAFQTIETEYKLTGIGTVSAEHQISSKTTV